MAIDILSSIRKRILSASIRHRPTSGITRIRQEAQIAILRELSIEINIVY